MIANLDHVDKIDQRNTLSELGPGWLGGGAWGTVANTDRKFMNASQGQLGKGELKGFAKRKEIGRGGPQAVLGEQRGGTKQMFGMGVAVELLDIVGTMVVQLEEN
uniref:Uncharacterized protein n=1 Tax=Globodera rostochiensis TaxID=31243 RepID=A0A914H789_GLORO